MKNLFSFILFIISLNIFSEVRLLSVEGVVEKSFKPNLISFNLGVWSRGNKAREAQKNQAEESERVKKIIAKFNVAEKDYMTVSYDLNPNYVYDQKTGQNNISGYQAQETLNVTLRHVEDAGKFMDEISSSKDKTSGVNINNINWDIDNREEVQKNLMGDAVGVALIKAQLLAKAANVKIKNVFRIVPGAVNVYSPPMANMKMLNSAMLDGGAAPQTNFQSGQVKVISNVNIDYEIE